MTVHNDTVEQASEQPELDQPYRELGLKDDEYAHIREILGRRPTDAELTMYSVMWSEHCSYKSSKAHLRYFGETMTEEQAAEKAAEKAARAEEKAATKAARVAEREAAAAAKAAARAERAAAKKKQD